MRYAQEYGGQRLHLVNEHIDNRTNETLVSTKALCGRPVTVYKVKMCPLYTEG